MLTATVQLPGSCGELVQGSLQGVPFHVTCPINMYSTVKVEVGPGKGQVHGPKVAIKAKEAAARTMQFLGRQDMDAELFINSPLVPGKGMASSTADVAGAILATGMALGHQLTPQQVAQIALSIEPSDGTFFPGIVVFDHRSGKMQQELGSPPPIDIIVLDFGGEVDTIAFNRQERTDILRNLEPQVEKALGLVREGIRLSSLEMIGEGATISAMANQNILYKPQLDSVLTLAKQVNALGVNVAHSGTVIGVLLEPQRYDVKDVIAFLYHQLPGLENVYNARLVGGGPRPAAGARPGLDGMPVQSENHPSRLVGTTKDENVAGSPFALKGRRLG